MDLHPRVSVPESDLEFLSRGQKAAAASERKTQRKHRDRLKLHVKDRVMCFKSIIDDIC